jgi:hypothetical protein
MYADHSRFWDTNVMSVNENWEEMDAISSVELGRGRRGIY